MRVSVPGASTASVHRAEPERGALQPWRDAVAAASAPAKGGRHGFSAAPRVPCVVLRSAWNNAYSVFSLEVATDDEGAGSPTPRGAEEALAHGAAARDEEAGGAQDGMRSQSAGADVKVEVGVR